MVEQITKDKTMGKKIYAPVLITTLNRYEHFKRCLESLEKCTGADKTDVYVALDFPPSEKYVEGWKKIDDYLHQKELENGFNQLYVIRRDHNYGVCHVEGNFEVLIRDINKVYDRHIESEDDNVFSKNFLEYINWGLNEYINDNRVFAIGGYNEVGIDTQDYNVFAYPRFCAWGCGIWKDRYDKVSGYYDEGRIIEILNKTKIMEVFSKQVVHHAHLIGMLGKKQIWFDSIVGCLPVDERFIIMPTISKVKNFGLDGSGQHVKDNKKMRDMVSHVVLDTDITFTPIIKDSLFNTAGIKEMFDNHYSVKSNITMFFKSMVVFLLWKIFKFNVYSL